MDKTYDEALKLLLTTKKNVFLTGPGGVGKTTLIHAFSSQTKNVMLTASTGTAAVNIGGITAHRAFAIPVPSVGARVGAKQKDAIRKLAHADCVVIDEISMLNNASFTFLWHVLKHAEKEKGKKIRLIVSGDFLQLPPVVTKNDAKLLKKAGLDVSGFAFTCPAWKEAHFTPVNLTEIKRQDDLDFIEHLNELRVGNPFDLSWFDCRVTDSFPDHTIRLTGTNAKAAEMNREALLSLDTKATAYLAKQTGRVSSAPMEKTISLQEKERVMFTVNSNQPGVYQNGLMGTVVSCEKDSVIVKTDDGRTATVSPYTWHLYNYRLTNGTLSRTETGTFSQIPLVPAYAITIHKSQGKTFDKAIISPRSFAPGQLYVALSRVKTVDGLYLTDPISESDLCTDPVAEKFYKNGCVWEIKKPAKKAVSARKKTEKKSAEKKSVKKTKKPAEKPAKKKAPAKKQAKRRKTA